MLNATHSHVSQHKAASIGHHEEVWLHCPTHTNMKLPYFLDWNAHILLVSSELLAGVVFEGELYSRARSIPFSLSVTKFFSKHNNFMGAVALGEYSFFKPA